MKKCTCCKLDKSLDNYFKSKAKSDGLQNTCKACMKLASNRSYKTNSNVRHSIRKRAKEDRAYKRKLLQRFKRVKGCLFCDEKEPIALDFHHVDPRGKDIHPSTLTGFGIEIIKKELAKCVVLCSNCHRKHHAGLEGFEINTSMV